MATLETIRHGSRALLVLLAVAAPGSALQSGDDLAINELIPNPTLDDEASGWMLDEASPVADLGPDDDPAVLLEAASDSWPSLTVNIPALLGGRQLAFSAQVNPLARGCKLWLTADSWGHDPDTNNWEILDTADSVHAPELGEWVTVRLKIDVPSEARALALRVTAQGAAPTLIDNVHLRSRNPAPPQTALEHTTLNELRAIVSRVLPIIAKLRQAEYRAAPQVRLATREAMYRHIESGFVSSRESDEAMGRAFGQLGAWPTGLDLYQTSVETMGSLVAGTWIGSSEVLLLCADTPVEFLEDLIAHEAVHALDDHRHALWSGKTVEHAPRTQDGWQAFAGATEGSAVLHQIAFMSAAGLSDATPESKIKQIGTLRVLAQDIPDLLKRRMCSNYYLGVNFLTRGSGSTTDVESVSIDVTRALSQPPLSTEQILHPEKYWSEDAQDLPKAFALEDGSAHLGEGWALVEEDTLGELMLALLVNASVPDETLARDPARWTHPAVAGWGYDVCQLYETSDGQNTTVLATLWDSVEDAEEFRQAVRIPEGALILQRDVRVVIAVTDGMQAGLADLAEAVISQLPEG